MDKEKISKALNNPNDNEYVLVNDYVKKFKTDFLLLFALAFILVYVPLVSIPFKLIETFFHEISHGIAGVLTGGRIDRIELSIDGSGLYYGSGGNGKIISFAGYFGASLWGVLIFLSADFLGKLYTRLISITICALIGIFGMLYSQDIVTSIIMCLLLILFALPITDIEESEQGQRLIKLIGLICLLNAIKSPSIFFQKKYDLLLSNSNLISDAESLYFATNISSAIWGYIWCACGITGLIIVWIIGVKKADIIHFSDI